MKARDFCYWLQGYFEVRRSTMSETEQLSLEPQEVECIEKHLALAFVHDIDPTFGKDNPKLDKIHNSPHKPPKMRC